MTKLSSLAVLAALLAACATPLAKVQGTALDRAAFDLGCPVAQLAATKLGDTTRIGVTPASPGVERTVIGVTGCGQKAVYVVECAVGDCNAQLNADTKPVSTSRQ